MSTSAGLSIVALGILAAALGLLALVDSQQQKERYSAVLVASVALMSLFATCAWLVGDEMNWSSVQSLLFIALPGVTITTAVGKHARLFHASLCLIAAGLVMATLTFNLLGTPWSIYVGAATFIVLLAADHMASRADGMAHTADPHGNA